MIAVYEAKLFCCLIATVQDSCLSENTHSVCGNFCTLRACTVAPMIFMSFNLVLKPLLRIVTEPAREGMHVISLFSAYSKLLGHIRMSTDCKL